MRLPQEKRIRILKQRMEKIDKNIADLQEKKERYRIELSKTQQELKQISNVKKIENPPPISLNPFSKSD